MSLIQSSYNKASMISYYELSVDCVALGNTKDSTDHA